MNANRRKRISAIWDKIEDLKAELESIMEEEQECFDNLPESLQDSERGDKMQEAVDALENAASSIDEVIEYLQEAIE
ncbi:MAG: hypothetical protein HDS71_09290 [Bacteroidales bacterium]|nr:hypothetical protein [Bacteroidales bacterium]